MVSQAPKHGLSQRDQKSKRERIKGLLPIVRSPEAGGYISFRGVKKSIGKESGFTVIEVLVAMTLFAVAILGLAVGAGSIMRANHSSYNHTIATGLAQDKIEELKAKAVTNIVSGGPAVTTVNNVNYTRTWTVTPNNPAAGVNKIDVSVTWTDYTNRTLTISSAVKQ